MPVFIKIGKITSSRIQILTILIVLLIVSKRVYIAETPIRLRIKIDILTKITLLTTTPT